MIRTLSTVLAVLALAACSSQQARDTLEYLPYGLAKGACKGSSNCTFKENARPKGGAEPSPGHWYEDGYGRDERVQRPPAR